MIVNWLFNISLLGVVAQVNIFDAAHRLQVLSGKLLEVIVTASTLVVLKVGGISPLEGGVTADAVLIA